LLEFASESGPVICPTFAALDGIVGHQVLKTMPRKFTRFTQFLAVGCMEAHPPWPIEFIGQKDRSDPYRRVNGNAQQEVMQTFGLSWSRLNQAHRNEAD
jgi:hypothetical protein